MPIGPNVRSRRTLGPRTTDRQKRGSPSSEAPRRKGKSLANVAHAKNDATDAKAGAVGASVLCIGMNGARISFPQHRNPATGMATQALSTRCSRCSRWSKLSSPSCRQQAVLPETRPSTFNDSRRLDQSRGRTGTFLADTGTEPAPTDSGGAMIDGRSCCEYSRAVIGGEPMKQIQALLTSTATRTAKNPKILEILRTSQHNYYYGEWYFWGFLAVFWVFAPQHRFALLIHHVEFVSGDLKRKPSASLRFFLGMPKVSFFRLLLGQLSGLLLSKRARVPIPVAG